MNSNQVYTHLPSPDGLLSVVLFVIQGNRTDILECLSVLINEDNVENNRTNELTLDEQLLGGTTLTAVTLPDGTQAFVANNFNDNGQALLRKDKKQACVRYSYRYQNYDTSTDSFVHDLKLRRTHKKQYR